MDDSLLNGLDLLSLCLSQGIVPHWNTVLKYWPYNCAVVMKLWLLGRPALLSCLNNIGPSLCVAFLTILSICSNQDNVDSI